MDSRPINNPLQPLRSASSSNSASSASNTVEAVPLNAQGDKCREQAKRVVAIGDEIQVHEDELARPMLADIRDDLLHGLLVRFASPGGGHDAEIAVVDTAAGGFKHVVGQITMARQQVAAGKRPVGQAEAGG